MGVTDAPPADAHAIWAQEGESLERGAAVVRLVTARDALILLVGTVLDADSVCTTQDLLAHSTDLPALLSWSSALSALRTCVSICAHARHERHMGWGWGRGQAVRVCGAGRGVWAWEQACTAARTAFRLELIGAEPARRIRFCDGVVSRA